VSTTKSLTFLLVAVYEDGIVLMTRSNVTLSLKSSNSLSLHVVRNDIDFIIYLYAKFIGPDVQHTNFFLVGHVLLV
jgi:hypothetical protein